MQAYMQVSFFKNIKQYLAEVGRCAHLHADCRVSEVDGITGVCHHILPTDVLWCNVHIVITYEVLVLALPATVVTLQSY